MDRITAEEYKRLYANKGSRSKYRNRKVTVNGIKFDSQHEANRWCELKLMERSGMISELERQVKFELIAKSEHGRAINYIADFTYRQGGKTVIEDAKGFKTAVYKLKKRMMAEMGLEIVEV